MVFITNKASISPDPLIGTEIENQQNLQISSTPNLKVQKAVQTTWNKHPAYIGSLTGKEAECKLKFLPVNSWLIRFSSREQCYVVSRKTAQRIEHILFSFQKTAEDLEKQYGHDSQIYFFRDILRYLNPSAPLCTKKPITKPKYDYQLQLDLGKGITASRLEEKAKTQKIASCTLSLKSIEQEIETSSELIKRLTHKSRLYLIGHAHPGASVIYSDMKECHTPGYAWNVDQLAVLISKNAPHLVKKNDEQRLKISLVVCHAGLNEVAPRTSSFAVQLSKTLDLVGIPTEILARTNDIDIPLEGGFRKQVKERHHVLGDKVSIITRQGQTTIQVVSYEKNCN